MKVSVSAYAYRHASDIDEHGHIDANELDGLVARCACCATDALKELHRDYHEVRRHHISSILNSMRWTHASIRDLIAHGYEQPKGVDGLALARLQLEALFAICAMVEDPTYVDRYVKDGWKRTYLRFLLEREECNALPRFHEYLNTTAPQWLKALQTICEVTDEERATVEREALGTPLPPGMQPQAIPRFPTPAAVIGATKDITRKAMLQRLYLDYQRLSAFIHALPDANFFKTVFDSRSPYGNLFPAERISTIFEKEVAFPAINISCISSIQCTSEIASLYPGNIGLRASLADAWNTLIKTSLLANTIWQIRTRQLLGAVK